MPVIFAALFLIPSQIAQILISSCRFANHFDLGYSQFMVYFAGHWQTIFCLGVIGSELAVALLSAPPE